MRENINLIDGMLNIEVCKNNNSLEFPDNSRILPQAIECRNSFQTCVSLLKVDKLIAFLKTIPEQPITIGFDYDTITISCAIL
jgi:hypothetical protein